MIFSFFNYFKSKSKCSTLIEKKINYNFTNKKLLKIAITHKSVNSKPNYNYERFELIGDSVINLIVTEWLSAKYPNANEGDLTTKRASLVNTFFLSKISSLLSLEENVIISKGVDIKNDVVLRNINADLYESITGAIYLDSNYNIAKKFVLNTLINNYELSGDNLNYKGILIEFCHKNYNKPPSFNIISSNGPDHDKSFEVKVFLKGEFEFRGIGKSIKDAEQTSAKKTLEKFNLI